MALTVMLYNICVTGSECGIEILISSMDQSNISTRPISLSQLQSEGNIHKNGPQRNGTSPGPIGSQFSKVILHHINSAPLPKL